MFSVFAVDIEVVLMCMAMNVEFCHQKSLTELNFIGLNLFPTYQTVKPSVSVYTDLGLFNV